MYPTYAHFMRHPHAFHEAPSSWGRVDTSRVYGRPYTVVGTARGWAMCFDHGDVRVWGKL